MMSRGKLLVQLAQNQRKKQENNTDLNKENENQNFAILKSVSIDDTQSYLQNNFAGDFDSNFENTDNIPVIKIINIDRQQVQENIVTFGEPSTIYDWSINSDQNSHNDPDFTGSGSSSFRPSNIDDESSTSGNSNYQIEKNLECEEEQTVNNERKLLTRKKKKNPSSWKRNIQKKLRFDGKPYYTQKGKLKSAKLIEDVECRCHYKCNTFFTKTQRRDILEKFLELKSQELRWSFIIKHVTSIPKKRCYADQNSNRANTYVYKLTSNGISRQVCQKFFLKTLAISSKIVRTAISKQTDEGTIKPDMRGRKSPPQKKSEEVKNIIRNHINSIPIVDSHYCRTTSKRKYVPSGLSERRLYEDYKAFCQEFDFVPQKFSFYKHIFTTEFNIGFHRPQKDQCDFCTKFENSNIEDKLALKEEYDLHLSRKQEAREHKEKDKNRSKTDSSFACFTMDMEKVLVTPSLNVGKLYYVQKLKTFNFTVYNLSNSEATNYMWHEGVGMKGSSEIATCLWKTISDLGAINEVTFYSDTATGQNRNSINAAMFLRAVVLLPIEIINQKFMESGHSEMECDSVHSAIDNRSSKTDIFTPEGWYAVVRTAKLKKPFYKVVELNYNDFANFKLFSSSLIKNRNKNTDGGNVNWLKIKWLQFRKEDPTTIFYKEKLSDPTFKSISIRKMTTSITNLLNQDIPALYTDFLPIEKKKLKSLIKLCDSKCIPETYHAFYRSLKSSEKDSSLSSEDEAEVL